MVSRMRREPLRMQGLLPGALGAPPAADHRKALYGLFAGLLVLLDYLDPVDCRSGKNCGWMVGNSYLGITSGSLVTRPESGRSEMAATSQIRTRYLRAGGTRRRIRSAIMTVIYDPRSTHTSGPL